ncbi:MAG: hypothetical protein AAGI51_07330, partial [Pseudomonadota bacterium]
ARHVPAAPGHHGSPQHDAAVCAQAGRAGVAALRPILDGGPNEESFAKAAALPRKIKVRPLAEADQAAKTPGFDICGAPLEITPKMGGGLHRRIHARIDEEVVRDCDPAMMGLLARFYGPEPSLFENSFELNDLERLDRPRLRGPPLPHSARARRRPRFHRRRPPTLAALLGFPRRRPAPPADFLGGGRVDRLAPGRVDPLVPHRAPSAARFLISGRRI